MLLGLFPFSTKKIKVFSLEVESWFLNCTNLLFFLLFQESTGPLWLFSGLPVNTGKLYFISCKSFFITVLMCILLLWPYSLNFFLFLSLLLSLIIFYSCLDIHINLRSCLLDLDQTTSTSSNIYLLYADSLLSHFFCHLCNRTCRVGCPYILISYHGGKLWW